MTPEPPAEHGAADAEGSSVAPSVERLQARLQRLEQQIRAFRELHVAEVSDLAQKLQTVVRLHADELQLILDELSDIAAELAPRREAESTRQSEGAESSPTAPAPPGDPAAGSPKRARWLAEEERRRRPVPRSRRDLLRGRGEDP